MLEKIPQKPLKKLYMLETLKNMNYGLRYNEKLETLVLKRISSTYFPAHYGRIEQIDTNQKLKKEFEKEKDDFFLITDRIFPVNIGITDDKVLEIGTFECVDERTQEKDNKTIIGLKGEVDLYPIHRIVTELDNIRSFLITLRGTFKVTGFSPSEGCPYAVKTLYAKIDWTNHSYWPKDFNDTIEHQYKH